MEMPRHIRTWYGLPGEVVIESDRRHWVKVGPVPLPHPPVVNSCIRRGLRSADRARLSHWHEVGHFETLPLALAHVTWLWRQYKGKRPGLGWQLLRLVTLFFLHQASWELAAEIYVWARSGRAYWRLYCGPAGRRLALFLVGTGGMTAASLLLAYVVRGAGMETRSGQKRQRN